MTTCACGREHTVDPWSGEQLTRDHIEDLREWVGGVIAHMTFAVHGCQACGHPIDRFAPAIIRQPADIGAQRRQVVREVDVYYHPQCCVIAGGDLDA